MRYEKKRQPVQGYERLFFDQLALARWCGTVLTDCYDSGLRDRTFDRGPPTR